MITTDTFIEIGSQHKVCEDYIIAKDNYIILADGCSRSENSDMGARILCYMAQQFMNYHSMKPYVPGFHDQLGLWIIHNAEVTARHLGLKSTSLDATLLIAYQLEDHIHIHMFGDGCILLQLNTMEIFSMYEIYSIDFDKNMPFYLRYLIDEDGKANYHKQKISQYLKCKSVFRKDDNEVTDRGVLDETAYDNPTHFQYPISNFKSISICSDGIASFLDPDASPNSNKLIEIPSFIHEILGFKVTTGEFLKRRMNKYSKQLKKAGVEHYDDLSIGTFLIEESFDGEDNWID